MAYCIMGYDSDVYAYEDVNGGFSGWAEGIVFNVKTRQELFDYLCRLKYIKGFDVPEYALEEIGAEIHLEEKASQL